MRKPLYMFSKTLPNINSRHEQEIGKLLNVLSIKYQMFFSEYVYNIMPW